MTVDRMASDPFKIKPFGLHLVEASAGTGKTTLLSVLFLKAVIVWNCPVDRIAVITFTRAATQELLARIRKDLVGLREYLDGKLDGLPPSSDSLPIPPLLDLLNEVSLKEAAGRIERAILDFDRVEIRTIHSFYQAILAEFSHLAGITEEREVVTRTEPYVFDATAEFLRDELEKMDPALRRYWFEKGITPLLFYNGEFMETPKPDPSQLTSRIIALTRGGWPVFEDDLLAGPDSSLLRERFSRVIKSRDRVEELSSMEKSDKRDALLSSPDFPFNILCAKSNQSSGIEQALGFKKCKASLLKESIGELSCSMDLLKAIWEAASKSFVRRMLVRVGEILEEKKGAARVSFQDDALMILLERLEREERESPDSPDSWPIHQAIRKKYDFFLVDEFQDTDPYQTSLLLRIGKDNPGGSSVPAPSMVFVGDPKQSIYRFRGADLQSYLHFREKMGGNLYGLFASYRQSSPLLSALNFLYSNHPSPFANPLMKAPEIDCASSRTGLLEVSGKKMAPIRILVKDFPSRQNRPPGESDVDSGDREEGFVSRAAAREIYRMLLPSSQLKVEEKRVSPGDIAVLVRKTREAHEMEKELQLLGVPSIVEKDGSVFETPEARELEWILLAILGRGGYSTLLAALSSELVGGDFRKLDGMTSDPQKKEEKLRMFSLLRKDWESLGFYRMAVSMIRELSIKENLEGRVDGKRKWINLNHLLDLLNRWEAEEDLLPERLLARFSRAIRRPGEFPVGEEEILRAEGASNAVRIMTIHKAKGLEFDVVFCPFFNKSGKISFPLKRRESSPDGVVPPSLLFKDEISEEDQEDIEQEEFSEELRILYVALTRARYHVTVVLNDQSGKDGLLPVSSPSPLLWLLFGCESSFSPDTFKAVFSFRDDLTPWTLAKMAQTHSGGTIAVERLSCAPIVCEPLEEESLSSGVLPAGEAIPETLFQNLKGWVSESFTSMVHFFEGQIVRGEPFLETEPPIGRELPRGGLPRGARTGTLIHELLENWEIDPATPRWIEFVRARLEIRGLDPDKDLQNALEMVSVCRGTAIDGKSLRLGEIPKERRISELAFSLPMEGYDFARFHALLKSLEIPLPEEWAAESKSHGRMKGMLSGAVDLFFFHEGQVSFVDYKTNDLGPAPGDYSQERLREALLSGGYFLQGLLYTVALDRHMKVCLGESYSYERDFGGGYFLFLRGLLPPRNAQDQGVFKIRFPVGTIMAVNAFFEHLPAHSPF